MHGMVNLFLAALVRFLRLAVVNKIMQRVRSEAQQQQQQQMNMLGLTLKDDGETHSHDSCEDGQKDGPSCSRRTDTDRPDKRNIFFFGPHFHINTSMEYGMYSCSHFAI